ncbi:MAG: RNA polymerase sporulation sigma factor SigE [Ruminococcaceae bacterium]|nr:RNA polymerase sporulation sigma factor SigE [Oscillospiraceae bacterium]
MNDIIDKLRLKLYRMFLRPMHGVYYINGAQTLPPPLEAERESELLEKIKVQGDDIKSRNILIEHNLRLVVYIAKKFENTGIGIEDLVSIGTIGLVKAINTFRNDKNIKLATYASRCVENEILMYLRKINPQKNEISIDEPLNVDWDGNELLLGDILSSEEDMVYRDIERKEEHGIIMKAVETLCERDKRIVYMRFGLCGEKEKTQKEVADLLGISQSYISRIEKKIINTLKKVLSQ